MANEGKIFDVKERCLRFGVKIVNFTDRFPDTIAGYEIGKQLLRVGTSIGANVEEADGAVSKEDFIYKIGIARKEALESNYWLKIIDSSNLFFGLFNLLKKQDDNEALKWLLNESTELTKILSSIIEKAKKNQ